MRETLTRVHPSYFDQRLQQREVATPLEFSSSRPDFLVKLFMGMFLGSRNPMVIVKNNFLSLSRDLETQGHWPCTWLWSHSMTFTFKVMEWLQSTSLYHLVPKHFRATLPRPEQSLLIPEACSPDDTDIYDLINMQEVAQGRFQFCPQHFTVSFGAEALSGHVAQAWAIPPFHFLVKLFMGMFLGSRNPMVIVKNNFLSLSRDLETQGHWPCTWLWSHSMTFTFKVMEWLHGIYS